MSEISWGVKEEAQVMTSIVHGVDGNNNGIETDYFEQDTTMSDGSDRVWQEHATN